MLCTLGYLSDKLLFHVLIKEAAAIVIDFTEIISFKDGRIKKFSLYILHISFLIVSVLKGVLVESKNISHNVPSSSIVSLWGNLPIFHV